MRLLKISLACWINYISSIGHHRQYSSILKATKAEDRNHNIQKLFHCAGLSCIGANVLLQVLTFFSIAQQGYFRAVENNPAILFAELVLTAFTVVYFGFLALKILKILNKEWSAKQ